MLLKDKVAVIYGAGGAIGSAVAARFARAGATVFLSGRTLETVERVSNKIWEHGGVAHAARVDALDEAQVESHLASVFEQTGRIDVSFNAVTPLAQPGIQGIPIAELSVEKFLAPINLYMRSQFITTRAAAKRMAEAGSGAILMNTPEPARIGAGLVGGMGPAWAAIEALSRNLSAEFGPKGVRSIVLRSTGMPETRTIEIVFGLHAQALGITAEQFQGFIESMTHRKRSTSVSELAQTAVFLASDWASAMTGTVANITGGLIADRRAWSRPHSPREAQMKERIRMSAKLPTFAAALLAIAAPATAEQKSPRAVVEAKFAAVNRHALEDISALYSTDALLNASDFCKPRHGRAEVARTYQAIFAFAPDAADDVQEYVVQGDRVAVRFIVRGTIGGHAFSVPLMDFFTVRDGLIVEDDAIFDNDGRACTP
jgi:NAD(P)-dependent dehydrogenase (short-subunit alcohol dehydrogenase family)/ketosteroid isomerase-like protein